MYKLDADSAKKADQIMNRIDETGKYVGQFTRAENVESRKGTKGVEFSFKSDDGQNADYLTVWTVNSDGKQLRGYEVLMAIMTCLKIKNIKPVHQVIEKYDADARQRVEMNVEVFPELMGKPIGLLLQREEYAANDGTIKAKMNIFGAFEPATGFTASEILTQAKVPATLEKMLAALKDKKIKRPSGQSLPNEYSPSSNGMDDLDDDIPF